MRRHEAATCPRCNAALRFGTKEEPTCWNVFYECSDRCGWELLTGHISRSDISHLDQVQERAQAMGEQYC
jgi:hypothetical protein